jgi:hypothetical protein
MARTKKTTSILPLVEYANRQLQRTDAFATIEFKTGISAFIEHILLDSGTYNGYTFNGSGTVPEPDTPGYWLRTYHTTAK